jgi:hypothetical protein
MRKKISIIFTSLIFACTPVLTSCGSFFGPSQEEVTVLAESVAKLQAMHIKQLEVMEAWVDKAVGITEEDRKKAKEVINIDRVQFTSLSAQLIKTINGITELDWKALSVRMLKEGREVYDSFLEHFGDIL